MEEGRQIILLNLIINIEQQNFKSKKGTTISGGPFLAANPAINFSQSNYHLRITLNGSIVPDAVIAVTLNESPALNVSSVVTAVPLAFT